MIFLHEFGLNICLSVSQYWESRFAAFFSFLNIGRAVLRLFFSFGRGRNALFAVFYSSAVAESRFSAIFKFIKVCKFSKSTALSMLE